MAHLELRDFPILEREAFVDACRRHGRVAQEFEVSARLDAPSASPQRTVLVELTEARHRLTYDGDHGMRWVEAFEASLAAGRFARPPRAG